MRIGIDTFSYHRLLGMVRAGESPPPDQLPDGGVTCVVEARERGCDVISLQTCFLGNPSELDIAQLIEEARGLELVLAWGHPEGLAFGGDADAAADLSAWIEVAATLASTTMRVVVGGPRLRGLEPVEMQLARCVTPLRMAAEHAAERGIRLLVENHADLTAAELDRLLSTVDSGVGVCLDTANAARVGDDPVEAARLLGARAGMVHLKDIAAVAGARDVVTGPVSVPFGEGIVPIGEVLRALDAPIRAGAAVCVELGQIAPGDDERVLIDRSLQWLRAWKGESQ